jgi:pimeloyl-ACP methyl ester carboxylesterase
MPTVSTRYARTGDASIAYHVAGDGAVDLVYVAGVASNVEMLWDDPFTAGCLRRLASFARVVLFDRRGTGLSDSVEHAPTLEQQMDDLRAVMRAVGLRKAALFGVTDTGLCAMYAASHPDEVTALVLWGATANGADATPPDERERRLEIVERAWGEGHMLPLYAPSRAGDARFTAWWARYERAIASPGMVRKLADLALRTDLRDVLPLIRVPTLVLHRHDDAVARVDLGRDVAARIPGARFLELSGGDNYPWAGDVNAFLDPMEEFLTGARGEHLPDRVLTTVVFTDLGDIGGIAVHIAARIMALAAPGEVLVSSTVRDLVVGSGLRFADRGAHELRGVPDRWHLFTLER